MPTAATPLSSQPMLTAQAGGRGRRKGGGAPEARTLLTFFSLPSFPSRAWLAWRRAEAQEQSRGGRGQSTTGKGPSAQGGGERNRTLPPQLPTEFTAQKHL